MLFSVRALRWKLADKTFYREQHRIYVVINPPVVPLETLSVLIGHQRYTTAQSVAFGLC